MKRRPMTFPRHTLTLTKKGEAAARVLKLSRQAK
jgi:hypothetical protein